jgi:hypothetical protein
MVVTVAFVETALLMLLSLGYPILMTNALSIFFIKK